MRVLSLVLSVLFVKLVITAGESTIVYFPRVLFLKTYDSYASGCFVCYATSISPAVIAKYRNQSSGKHR